MSIKVGRLKQYILYMSCIHDVPLVEPLLEEIKSLLMQYSVIIDMGKRIGKRIDVYICITELLCCVTEIKTNIVYQLYFTKKKKEFIIGSMLDSSEEFFKILLSGFHLGYWDFSKASQRCKTTVVRYSSAVLPKL